MAQYSIQHLYAGLKQAVMDKPELETWKVLEYMRGGEMFSSNLGATTLDKGKNYFWSKAWADSGYSAQVDWRFPILTTFEVNADIAQQTKRVLTFNIEISLLEKYDETNDRTINELFEDTERWLFDVLVYLERCALYSIDNSDKYTILHVGKAASMLEQGAIMSATKQSEQLLTDTLTVSSLFRVTYPAENVFGTGMLLNFKARQGCINPEFDHEAYIKDCLNNY